MNTRGPDGRAAARTGTGPAAVPAGWEHAVAAVPRRLFLPDLIWPYDERHADVRTVDRSVSPDEWAASVEDDAAIVTQWDDGAHTGPGPGTMPTSSATQRSLVLRMLGDLEVADGHRVLDIGVGTGWTTALLAKRLGERNVVGLEIDQTVAVRATGRLHAVGLDPLVVCGDGADGWDPGAPYDRIQITYAVHRISPAWLEQARPGGLIVAPWRTHLMDYGAVVRLEVGADGTASGHFTRRAGFMLDRHQRGESVRPRHRPGERPAGTRASTATLSPATLWDDPAAVFAAGLGVPGVTRATDDTGEGTGGGRTVWLASRTCPSWAMVGFDGDVHQAGPRDLWTELEAAYAWWYERNRPAPERYGLTVTPAGQHVWLDRPGAPVGG